MKDEVIDFTRKFFKWNLCSDGFGIERYVDYQDKISESTINKILSSETPIETFDELMIDWDCNADDWFYEDSFFNELKDFCNDKGFDFEEAKDFVTENFHWCYPETFLNPEIDVTFTINNGDMNFDYSLHNQLSYARNYYSDSSNLDKKAGLYLLARTQGKVTALKKAIKDICKEKIRPSDIYDDFVRTATEELENLTGSIAPLVIVAKIKLYDAIDLAEKINSISDDIKFNPEQIKDCSLGYVTFPKTVICGFNGYYASSLMGIKLEKDFKIPLQNIIHVSSADWYYSLCVHTNDDLMVNVKIA